MIWRNCVLLAAAASGPAHANEAEFLDNVFLEFEFEARMTADIALADVDGDGDLDVLAANGRHWAQPDLVYLNHGNGRLLEARPVGDGPSATYRLQPGDFDGDGDGDTDLAIARRDGESSLGLLNDGAGAFTAAVLGGTAGDNRKIVAADFDGDGRADLMLGRAEGSLAFLKNEGGGRFGQPQAIAVGDQAIQAMAALDIDSDGRMDLAVGVEGSNALVLNRGADGYRIMPIEEGAADTYGIAAGDLDGDGQPDIAVANSENSNKIMLNRTR